MKFINPFIKKTLFSALVLTASFTGLTEEKVIKWKIATTWNETLSPFIDAPKNMAKLVESMSGGRFIIKLDAANKHKAPLGIIDLVKSNQYEMGHSASYYWKGKDIETLPFTTMPFGMTTPEQYAWFYYGGGLGLMQKAYAKHGMLSFPGGNTGNQMGGWFRKEINSLEDLQGLKMRIPGFAGEVMAKLGVAVTNIAVGELYTSLERGTIDALEWVGPGMDLPLGFYKIAPYYYTGWHEPATELQFVVNQKAYDALPEDLKQILLTAMRVSAYDMYIENYHMSALAWQQMLKEHPEIQIKTFPQPVMDAIRKANDEILREDASKNALLKETLDSQMAYQKVAREWTKISDYDYLQSVEAQK